MFGHSKPVMLSLFVVFTVSIALLQENTFERVSIKYGKVISISQARSVFTCVESCLQHCECRFVRFTKINNTCQLFADVLLYYGSNSMPSSSDVVDFKKMGISPPRYQAFYVDMVQTSHDHAQSICEKFGSGLATVLDQLDFETLNTTTLGLSPPRYQAVYVDMNQTSYAHAQSIYEIFGSGLATILDKLDFETLNTTLKGIHAQEYCDGRMFLGAKSPGNSVWSWRTGEPISNDWEHWAPDNPYRIGESCMRMVVNSANWMQMLDRACPQGADLITLFKCCICDTLP